MKALLFLALMACAPAKAQRTDLPVRVADQDTARIIRYGIDGSMLQATGFVVSCYIANPRLYPKAAPVPACVAVPVARPIDR